MHNKLFGKITNPLEIFKNTVMKKRELPQWGERVPTKNPQKLQSQKEDFGVCKFPYTELSLYRRVQPDQ